jgi:predicted dehydrogenase
MKKVRIGILGCGGMAGFHLSRLRANADAELVALCDAKEEIARAFAERHLKDHQPQPVVYPDPAAMYAGANLDAVLIATPHTQHFEQGAQAIRAGCHVLMEKPMVTSSRQAHELAAIVAESGLVFTIGYNTPCTPEMLFIRNLIRSGEMGRLATVSCWQTQDWRKFTIGTWRQDPALSGGGMMYDSGAHVFNTLVWTVEQPVAEVAAFIDNVGTPVDIVGTVNMRFANGTLATMAIDGNCTDAGSGMVYTFETGRVSVDAWGGAWIEVFKKGSKVKYPRVEGEFQAPLDNFVDAILGRADPRTNPRYGILQSEIMDAIYESAKTGTIVSVKSSA